MHGNTRGSIKQLEKKARSKDYAEIATRLWAIIFYKKNGHYLKLADS